MGKDRKKQSLLCGVIVLVGSLLLAVLSVGFKVVEELPETEEVKEVVKGNDKEEMIPVDVGKLFTYKQSPLEEGMVEALAKQLPGSSCLEQVIIQEEREPYYVTLVYNLAENDVNLLSTQKEQIALVNSVTLMSLFEAVDTVILKFNRGDDKEEKILYRPELQDYFGFPIKNIGTLPTFERLFMEFMDMKKVSAYWNQSHPYDTPLGLEASYYFKTSFPLEEKDKMILSEESQALEKTLEAQYGYQLFLQGLKYDNDNMNKYCANQLAHFYGSEHKEEILIELIACSNQSTSLQVKEACQKAKQILGYNEKEQPFFFTLENQSKEEHKLYGIIQGDYKLFAQWQGEEEGRIAFKGISSDNNYMVCQVMTETNQYLYSLPVHQMGCYSLQEQGAQLKEKSFKEIYSLLDKEEKPIEEGGISWQMGPFLKLETSKETYIYLNQEQELVRKEIFDKTFNLTDFMLCLQGKNIEVIENEAMSKNTIALTLEIEGEKVRVYTFNKEADREKAWQKLKNKTGIYTGTKGKIVSIYEGNNEAVLSLIKEVMKV